MMEIYMNELEIIYSLIRDHVMWIKKMQSLILRFFSDPSLTLETQSILHGLAQPQCLPQQSSFLAGIG